MKILTIGDIHGRQYWKSVDPNKYDKIIFVGDYVDQFPPMTDIEIENNLLEIIEFKKQYLDKIVLLIGNHDVHYMFLNEGFQCSGYRPSMAMKLKIIFNENKKLFDIAYQIDKYIWSHAGISQGWYDFNKKEIEETRDQFNCSTLADTLNRILYTNNFRILFQCGIKRSGRYNFGGLTWADRKETMYNYLPDYFQIVGHTPISNITKFGDDNGNITYVDVLNEVDFWEKSKTNKKYATQINKFYELEIEK